MKNSEFVEVDTMELENVNGGFIHVLVGAVLGLVLVAAYEVGKADARR
ncbi:MAG: class IIb bacteriocin, lactobin A/cerein 7B family [Proteiniphilum sp.]|jgi:lactobin A/cerein 7B family class IIb bacteriocin